MTLTITRGSKNAPLDPLRDRTVAVLGYGNQGRAHALNLRDSGISVVVGSRSPGSSATAGARQAEADGFDVHSIEDGSSAGDLVIIALPDEVQSSVFEQSIAPNLREGATIGFLHGFAIRYGAVTPAENLGVMLVAPKGPGTALRERYVEGLGLPCLFAVHQDSPAGDTEAIGLAWAGGIGCARTAIIRTTFADEAETDLFGEQAVLCGGMTWLVLAAFETLVEAGYPPELAYLECCHEVKQVADLMHEGGLAAMMRAISNTAEFGAYEAGPLLVDEHVRERMKERLAEIRNGAFAMRFQRDHDAGSPAFQRHRNAVDRHPIEAAGKVVRSLMPWLVNNADQQRKPRE